MGFSFSGKTPGAHFNVKTVLLGTENWGKQNFHKIAIVNL